MNLGSKESLKDCESLKQLLEFCTKDTLVELHEITLGTKSSQLNKQELTNNILNKETSMERLLRRQCIPVGTIRMFMDTRKIRSPEALDRLSKKELVQELVDRYGNKHQVSDQKDLNSKQQSNFLKMEIKNETKSKAERGSKNGIFNPIPNELGDATVNSGTFSGSKVNLLSYHNSTSWEEELKLPFNNTSVRLKTVPSSLESKYMKNDIVQIAKMFLMPTSSNVSVPVADTATTPSPDIEIVLPKLLEVDFNSLKIGKHLGQGAFGTVKLYHCEDGAAVAVKELAPLSDIKETEKLFLNEIKILRKVSHPRLLNLIGFSMDRERCLYWIITDFHRGGNLNTLLHNDVARRAKLSDTIKMRFAFEIAEGLADLHKQHIMHRDMKPENILLTNTDPAFAHLVVCDFGTARDVLWKSRNNTVGAAGTLLFMAPEVASGRSSTLHSDVWSFGVILYELFHSKYSRPFSGDESKAFKELTKDHPTLPGNFFKTCKFLTDTGDLNQIQNLKIKQIINLCWQLDFTERLSMDVIKNLLEEERDNNDRDKDNIQFICEYVNNRVTQSQTLYKIGASKQNKLLSESRRISLMLNSLEEDIRKRLTKNQRNKIRKSIESGKFIQHFSSLAEVTHPKLDERTENCIYVWRRKTDKMGYVGKTKKRRNKRDKQHKDSNKTVFEKALVRDEDNNWENWEVVTVCEFSSEEEMERLEPLFIILFNTSNLRSKPMGWNVESGGSWGASIMPL